MSMVGAARMSECVYIIILHAGLLVVDELVLITDLVCYLAEQYSTCNI